MKKTAFVILLTVLFAFCSCNTEKSEIKSEPAENKETEYFKAVWLNYNELSMSGAEPDENVFRNKAQEIISELSEHGFNRIIMQVRPFSDAFYNSEIFPSSRYLAGVQGGDVPFDALEIMLDEAHKRGIKLDAWINPYRVLYSIDINLLSENNPAKIFLNDESKQKNVVITDNAVYYNPAKSEVKKLIVDGVREILDNYDVDGIHFDDYFYPPTDSGFDFDDYSVYVSEGGRLSLDDWRRENVSALISEIYSLVKSKNENLIFSVSPMGNIDKDYNSCYADIYKWCAEEGYIDYIIPQLYFGFENENMPYISTAEKWLEIERCKYVNIAFGLAFYKCGREDTYAGTGSGEWINNENIIERQIRYILSNDKINGFCLYSYSYIFSENINENCKKELQNAESVIQYKK